MTDKSRDTSKSKYNLYMIVNIYFVLVRFVNILKHYTNINL